MSNTSNASKNVKRFLLLFALGVAYGFMYVMPYMKSSFYDQMIAAMGCTNAQLGSLMTYYTIALTISYLPGGWIGDKFNPKPVLLASIFGQAILSFLFMFTYQSYTMAVIIWLLMALTGGFAFWPAIMKGIRMTGTDEEQGRLYGIFEALNGFASLLLSFIMIGIMAIAGKGDLVTGFKSALACMGGLSIVSGLLVLFLMPKEATYGTKTEENAESGKITFKDYLSAFKIPGVWIMAILVWCYVTISAVASYLTPYSTDVLGMSAVVAASIGTIRTYGHFPDPAGRHEQHGACDPPASGGCCDVPVQGHVLLRTGRARHPDERLRDGRRNRDPHRLPAGYVCAHHVWQLDRPVWRGRLQQDPALRCRHCGSRHRCGGAGGHPVQEGRKAQSSRAGCVIRAYYKEAYPHEQDQDQHSPLQRLWLLRE